MSRRTELYQDDLIAYVWSRFSEKFTEYGIEGFEKLWDEYWEMESFKACENVFDKNPKYNDKHHFIMRQVASYYLDKVFKAMLMEDDPNIGEDLNAGNIGSKGRIIKCWTGANTDDDTELGCGRFMKRPRIATFPNDKNTKIPITKRISVTAQCSHHFVAFSTLFGADSYAIVSYIPGDFVLGISKLQRLADFVCRRFWLQEDLTKALYDEIAAAAKTKDVYVGLFNLRHGCEWLRGSRNYEGGFSSEYYEGAFMDDTIRQQAIQSAK